MHRGARAPSRAVRCQRPHRRRAPRGRAGRRTHSVLADWPRCRTRHGARPCLLGYGGFEVALDPQYDATAGIAWLERGDLYAIANIRGGGEFGPAWHQAALRENSQVSFDDFIAVAQALINSNVTSAAQLGIRGGSNGGLLTAVCMVQRPDLFGAVLSEVPLIDMARFHLLLQGASWIDEYGDPDDADDLHHLMTYSPYQNVKADVTYPPALFTSSASDRPRASRPRTQDGREDAGAGTRKRLVSGNGRRRTWRGRRAGSRRAGGSGGVYFPRASDRPAEVTLPRRRGPAQTFTGAACERSTSVRPAKVSTPHTPITMPMPCGETS